MPTSGARMLPGNVRPSKYSLSLEPNLVEFTFKGREAISIDVLEPTDAITLNCAELEIQSGRLTRSDGTSLSPADTSFNEEDETVTFRFESSLAVGPATLEIEFTGVLNDMLRGFYRSKYTDDGGQELYLATTQFEATDARRAFPCWDEPSLKATFLLSLRIPSDLVALSNMPVASEQTDGLGLRTVVFDETPVMSTYFLAFIVGDLRSVERAAPSGTLLRVWATPGNEERGHFTLDVAERLLAYFNDYFDIPYPLEKLDHVAIPDFAAGAMENWGLITYRETAILVDPESSSARTRQIVASIVAHEMAHMWFGDLVTMTWWDALWLNESFASWMGDKAVDNLYPEWETWTQFVSSEANSALSLDGLKNSHPIEQEVKNPAEIGQLFDAISYSKGGSVLRMLEHYLGAQVFRQGLRLYLRKHQYGNAHTKDLWDALGEASGKPVAEMMDTWVSQTGYPVVEVQMAPHGGNLELSARQGRFVYEHLVERDAEDETLWQVPLIAASSGGGESAPVLMQERRASLSLPIPRGEPGRGWVKINPQQTGFYRVNYSAQDWDRLRPAIQRRELSAPDRLGLQNDAYSLSKAGYLPVTQFLSLLGAYVDETDAYVWQDLATNLGALDSLLADEPFHDRFRELARRTFGPAVGRVGWDAAAREGHLDALLRSTVVEELGRYGDEDTLAQAGRRFEGYVDEPGSLHPDMRRTVFALAAKRADRARYDRIWALQEASAMEEERVRLLSALTQVERPELLDETLERSLSAEVRFHNTIGIITGVAGNRFGRERAWEFVKENWPELDRRYGEGKFALMRLVGMTARFTTQEKLDDVRRFFEANPAPGADRAIRQSLEVVQLNIAWLEQARQPLAQWFANS